MEIDIFPIARKEGIHYYIGAGFLGLVIITDIIGAWKAAVYLIGEDKELLCLLAAIPIFIGMYSILVLALHCAKVCLYAYFKVNRKELNKQVNQEAYNNYIITHLEDIQNKLDRKAEPQQVVVAPPVVQTVPEPSKNDAQDDDLQPDIMPELNQEVKIAMKNLGPFIQQVHIDRIQMSKAKAKHDKEKLEKILKYTNLVLLPHGFSNEEMYQIVEAIKLLVQCNGVVNCVSVNIKKNKLKQADLKNFAWNIGYQYDIDSEILALFVLNLFHAWFKNTEKDSIRKTLRTTSGKLSIEIDENILDHLPELEAKILGKDHK